jgi:EAL and modified HD-GYP domain-containing signal transduction protein
MMEHIYIGRQPIYGRNMALAGYELLHRAGPGDRAEISDGDLATSEVLISSCLDFGLQALAGEQPAFVNLTRSFITGERALPFASGKIVLEVLEDIAFDAPVLDGLRRLAAQGYTIALDDFQLRPDSGRALEIAHIVKLDVLQQTPAQIERQVQQLRRFDVKLLAEKVESHEMYEHCRGLGFDYFQGYFFCKPHLLKSRRPDSYRGTLLSLLAALQNPQAKLEELERFIAQNAALTLRLLRYINSAGVGFGRTVTSVRQALLLIGTRTIQNWVSLILFTRVVDKPTELTRTALVRARMCELLAAAAGVRQRDGYFTVGLFSALDALMDRPMDELLKQLPLAPEVKAALLSGDGVLGETLRQVLDYEAGAWEHLSGGPLSAGTYRSCYVEAVHWADASLLALAAPDERPPQPTGGRTPAALSQRVAPVA